MKFNLYVALIPMLLAPASLAHAESEIDSHATLMPYAQSHDFRFDLSTGVFAQTSSQDSGVTLGANLLHRNGLLEYGIDATYGSSLFSYSYGQASAAGGLGWQTRSGLRLEALGEFGGTFYSGVGKEILSDNPGVSGLAPTVGAKAGVSYLFSPNAKDHFVVGLWAYGDDDLTRETKSISYSQAGFFGSSTPTTDHETIGNARVGMALSIGGVLPL